MSYDSRLEPTVPDLQTQLERLIQAIHDVESRLGEWGAIERRLQQDVVQRTRQIEAAVEQEWESLRIKQEEPVKQLREQATALSEVCVAAANLSLKGFERAEARFEALQKDLQAQLTQLSRDLQTAIVDSKREPKPTALSTSVEPFPLEGVMRIHEELRDSDRPPVNGGGGPATSVAPVVERPLLPIVTATATTAPEFTNRLETLEREVTHERQEVRDAADTAARMQRDWRRLMVGVGVAVIAVIVLGWRLQVMVTTRLDEAAQRTAAAEQHAADATEAANKQAAARASADKEVAAARDTVQRAQIISDVLAAPDLARYALFGANGASAQALWSRSRGFVLSASRLAAVPAGLSYQIWLQTEDGPVNAGAFTPDETGRATIVLDPPRPPKPVVGVLVTAEAAANAASPTGTTVLSRTPQ